MKIQNGQNTTLAFNELNERSGRFALETHNAEPLPDQSTLVGAICVRFALSDTQRLRVWPELTSSI